MVVANKDWQYFVGAAQLKVIDAENKLYVLNQELKDVKEKYLHATCFKCKADTLAKSIDLEKTSTWDRYDDDWDHSYRWTCPHCAHSNGHGTLNISDFRVVKGGK